MERILNAKKDKYKLILIFIIIIAILIRIIFINKTNIAYLQFDVGIQKNNNSINYERLYTDFSNGYNEGRHINYIMHLYTYNTLPTQIMGQFYHPPLHHFLMANWLKVMDLFTNSSAVKFESMQFITLIYSMIIIFSFYKILDELKIESKNQIIPMLLLCFYPLNIYLSGSINNDELVIMFSIICLLYLIKWNKNPNIKNTIIIATSIGMGLMTKSSMYVMLIPTVFIYFKTLSEYVYQEKKIGKLLFQLLLFTIISSILGLWFQIRSMIKGLDTLGIIQPYESLSVADSGFLERFGICNPLKMSGINIWNYLIYSSLNFALILENSIYIKLMVIIAITLIIDSIYYIIKKFKNEKILIVCLISWWVFYFVLNIQMPYSCSMHSRYMVIPILISFIYLGKGIQDEKNEILKKQVYISTITLSIMSLGLFLFLI